MKMNRVLIGTILLALTGLLLLATLSSANGLGYTLDWWTVDGGGGTWSDTGEQYELDGTAGQPDASVWSDSEYILTGGFWSGAAVQYRTYLPLVVKN